MSFFVRPQSRISSKISSKIPIFVQICRPAIERHLISLQTDKYVLVSKSVKRNAECLYITVDLFDWKVTALNLMSALILHCATYNQSTMFRDKKYLDQNVIYRRRKSLMSTKNFVRISNFRPYLVQNCEFRFSSKMLNLAISFVFRTRRICCVRTDELEDQRKISTYSAQHKCKRVLR